jgi:Bacterial Ig-like domain (group 2)
MLRIVLKLVVLVLRCAVAAQDSGSKPTTGNLLQITSPATGAVVNPGQTMSVTVISPTNTVFRQVAVLAEPIGLSSLATIATSAPAHFSFSIPTNISCRWYTLMAVGITPSGQEVSSPEVSIDVERSDLPTLLYTQIPAIEFENLGETFPIMISATFSDRGSFDVTESSKLIYDSSNSNVATVDATGMVTALGVGKASITATYGGNLHITIPTIVPPQALDPSPSSLDFGNQIVGIGSNPQQISLTNKTAGPMKILVLNTTGDFSEKDNCQSLSPLAAGSRCTINVTFTPTVAGLRKGSVNISNSFSGSLAISLSGTATTSLQ